MLPFDLIAALAGGALIGTASVLLMLLNGRIAGITGIMAGRLTAEPDDRAWRLAFIAGLIAAPLLAGVMGVAVPVPQVPGSWPLIVVAGLLIGFGARLGGGCTSGHGICGLSRRSPRAMVATCTFTATAVCVVAIMRHGIGR